MSRESKKSELDLPDLLKTIGDFKPGRPLKKFVGKIVFPNFKNFAPGAEVRFDHPLTALVGPNGSGKSSLLHALWGMPKGKSTSRFWFSTALDPIEEGGENGISRYFYSHWIDGLNDFVETRKVRGRKREGYWEPARLLESDGMAPLPPLNSKNKSFRSKSRWNPVDRKVVYINFKCEFGAFDRYFYFPDRGTTQEKRQRYFMKGAERLRSVIDSNRQSYKLGRRQSVYENRKLNASELNYVSYILGRNYSSAQLIKHRLYAGLETSSVLFQTDSRSYSEAYAGSGELAIVTLVTTLVQADDYSLVLLDEPETSLHPGALERMLAFLLHMIKTKHVQVVMSTHSPTVVNLLPTKAIRVIGENADGRFDISTVTHPQVAFNRLGHVHPEKTILVVEDQLLLEFVEIALSALDDGERAAFQTYIPPGGADSILNYEVPMLIGQRRKAAIILDGDQARDLPDIQKLTTAEVEELPRRLKELRLKPMHMASSPEKVKFYIDWLNKNQILLEAICPEILILEQLTDSDHASKYKTNEDAKGALVETLYKQKRKTDAVFINSLPSAYWSATGLSHPAINALTLALRGKLRG